MKLNNPNTSGSAGDGTLIDKDERNGIPGTLLKAGFFNQLIYEFNTLIKEGGLIPSDKDLTQVYTAIRNLYTNADKELKNYFENKISIESGKIIQEIQDRKEADSNLQNQINTAIQKINKEITDRKSAVTSLQNKINTLNQNINKEITDRTNADTALKSSLEIKINETNTKINKEIADRNQDIISLENKINNIKKSYYFIIKETVTKTGTGTQQWNLTWRNDVEYIMMRGSVSCNHTNFGWSADYGFFQDFNKDEAAFIGMKAHYAERYYFGNTAVQTVNVNGAATFEAGLSHEKWFPLNSIKPVLGIKKMNQTTTITASLEFLVRYK